MRGLNRKLTNENSAALWHNRLSYIFRQSTERLILDKILNPSDFTNFDVCVNYIKRKHANKKRFEANKAEVEN